MLHAERDEILERALEADPHLGVQRPPRFLPVGRPAFRRPDSSLDYSRTVKKSQLQTLERPCARSDRRSPETFSASAATCARGVSPPSYLEPNKNSLRDSMALSTCSVEDDRMAPQRLATPFATSFGLKYMAPDMALPRNSQYLPSAQLVFLDWCEAIDMARLLA